VTPHRYSPRQRFLAMLMSPIFLLSFLAPGKAEEKRVCKLGEYHGYTKPLYNEWVRISQYVAVRDGTRLAVDIFRPSDRGTAVADRLPAVWTHTRYGRANAREGKLATLPERLPALKTLLRYGYVVAIVDVRGSGASFGSWEGSFSPKETRDAYDVTEWFAAQPWCNGKVGMFGPSYLGSTQLMAASEAPPHLKAIFPQKAPGDIYALVYPGGIFRRDFCESWGNGLKALDLWITPVPVDGDDSHKLLNEARKERETNQDVLELALAYRYRDSVDPVTKESTWAARSPFGHLDAIRRSKIPVYNLGGWFDTYTRDSILAYANLDNPKKLVIGPWTHQQEHDLDLGIENVRWFDRWLKDVDNGIMEEPRIHYYVTGNPKGPGWRSATEWPLPKQRTTAYFFHSGPSHSVASVNDGVLTPSVPEHNQGSDRYTVDYKATSGRPSRWSSGYGLGGKEFNYGDRGAQDKKGMTYTTEPLATDLEVTGHPIVHLWINSTAKDGDFFAYLEDVDGSGYAHYVTEGCLRASNRAIHDPPYNFLGLPYHRSFKSDYAELPGMPVELVFDMQPTSIQFHQGHRVRVTITCADKDNDDTPRQSPPPKVTVYRSNEHASYVVLPVIPAQ
jgi:uncharacterized protein